MANSEWLIAIRPTPCLLYTSTSYALRRRQGISEEDDFLDRFNELMLLETRGFPAGHPFHNAVSYTHLYDFPSA